MAEGRIVDRSATGSAGPQPARAFAEVIMSIALNVITGFLGSGKTTLLKRLLADENMGDTALLINEFGDVGIDHLL
ncbi:hypothetical protein ALP71_05039, partial [Pseudomonas coronafaciens pv. garcae]